MRCYRSYVFSIPKHRVPIYSTGIRAGKSLNKGLLSLITKEIITTKDDSYYFVENLKSEGYRGFNKRENGKSG